MAYLPLPFPAHWCVMICSRSQATCTIILSCSIYLSLFYSRLVFVWHLYSIWMMMHCVPVAVQVHVHVSLYMYISQTCGVACCAVIQVHAPFQNYLRVGNPQFPMPMRRARNASTSFVVSGDLHSCALACGCVCRCSLSLSRYWLTYRVVSVWMSVSTRSSKKSRKQSIGELSHIRDDTWRCTKHRGLH